MGATGFEVRGIAPEDTFLMAVAAPHAQRIYHPIHRPAGEMFAVYPLDMGHGNAKKAQYGPSFS